MVSRNEWYAELTFSHIGLESETNLLKLTSASQKERSSNSSSIFQNICQGKQMYQKLKDQTDQLKTKVIHSKLIIFNVIPNTKK